MDKFRKKGPEAKKSILIGEEVKDKPREEAVKAFRRKPYDFVKKKCGGSIDKL